MSNDFYRAAVVKLLSACTLPEEVTSIRVNFCTIRKMYSFCIISKDHISTYLPADYFVSSRNNMKPVANEKFDACIRKTLETISPGEWKLTCGDVLVRSKYVNVVYPRDLEFYELSNHERVELLSIGSTK